MDTDPLAVLLRDVHEIESFLHDFLSQLMKRRIKPGTDVTKYAEELGLKVPASLQGTPIVWAGIAASDGGTEDHKTQVLVIARPGVPDAIGLQIGCVRIRGHLFCLECGWFWCRIVIKW